MSVPVSKRNTSEKFSYISIKELIASLNVLAINSLGVSMEVIKNEDDKISTQNKENQETPSSSDSSNNSSNKKDEYAPLEKKVVLSMVKNVLNKTDKLAKFYIRDIVTNNNCYCYLRKDYLQERRQFRRDAIYLLGDILETIISFKWQCAYNKHFDPYLIKSLMSKTNSVKELLQTEIITIEKYMVEQNKKKS